MNIPLTYSCPLEGEVTEKVRGRPYLALPYLTLLYLSYQCIYQYCAVFCRLMRRFFSFYQGAKKYVSFISRFLFSVSSIAIFSSYFFVVFTSIPRPRNMLATSTGRCHGKMYFLSLSLQSPCHPPAPLITGMLPRAEVVAREDALCFLGSCCRH